MAAIAAFSTRLIYEIQAEFGFNVCVIHPLVLSGMEEECGFPDIHGGKIETSLMLVFAPQLVRQDAAATLTKRPDPNAIERVILDLGVSWPWSSGDRALADQGVTGDATVATAEFGRQIVESLLGNVRSVLGNCASGARVNAFCRTQWPLPPIKKRVYSLFEATRPVRRRGLFAFVGQSDVHE